MLLLLWLLLRRVDVSRLFGQFKVEQVQQQGQFQQQLTEQLHNQRQHLQQLQQDNLLQVLQKITETQQSARFELSKNLLLIIIYCF